MRDVLTREAANRFAAQPKRHIGEGPPGEIDHRPSQRFVEWREGPSETVHPTPLAQRAVERFTQRERAVLGRVVIVHRQVALAGERQVEARVAAECVKEMIEEADAGLDRCLAGAVEIERHANRRFARRASDSHRARAHGSNSSRSASRSRTRAAPASVNAPAVTVRSSPGATMRSEEHTSELQSRLHLVCRLLLEKKK